MQKSTGRCVNDISTRPLFTVIHALPAGIGPAVPVPEDFVMLRLLLILTCLVMLFTQDALADTPRSCGPRENVVARLAERFGESQQAIGLTSAAGLLEVYASRRTGSWTLLLTDAEGRSCLLASGAAFEAMPLPVPGRPA